MTASPTPFFAESANKSDHSGDGRQCSACGKSAPEVSFSLKSNSPTKLAARCDLCRERPAVTWNARNPDKVRAASLRFREKGGDREGRLRSKYKITQSAYDARLQRQGGGCAICSSKSPGGRWFAFHVDHDHTTGTVRGLLCTNCNRGVGYMGDDAARLGAAARYLEANKMVPAGLPSEEIRRIIDDAMNSAIPETWEVIAHATARLEALFAPILAEKERRDAIAREQAETARFLQHHLDNPRPPSDALKNLFADYKAAGVQSVGLDSLLNACCYRDQCKVLEARALAAEAAMATERSLLVRAKDHIVQYADDLSMHSPAAKLVEEIAAAIRSQGE